mmetsp:Transcript_11246/g.41181  ORF Transcript_11246/g.41181 Transcript_11246/m.41181 type:complete len:203 (+) Transcript_11246:582-1190(+)
MRRPSGLQPDSSKTFIPARWPLRTAQCITLRPQRSHFSARSVPLAASNAHSMVSTLPPRVAWCRTLWMFLSRADIGEPASNSSFSPAVNPDPAAICIGIRPTPVVLRTCAPLSSNNCIISSDGFVGHAAAACRAVVPSGHAFTSAPTSKRLCTMDSIPFPDANTRTLFTSLSPCIPEFGFIFLLVMCGSLEDSGCCTPSLSR